MNIDILTDAEIYRLRKILASSHRVVVCCHKSPDGDAVGSSLAWAEFLRTYCLAFSDERLAFSDKRLAELDNNNTNSATRSTLHAQREVTVVLPDAAPDFLHWMPGFQTSGVLRYDKKPEEVKAEFEAADLVCCLDFNATSRTDEMQEVLDGCTARRMVIDHHERPDIKAALTISRPRLSSTCELVFCIINQLGGYDEMSKDCATNLYAGMMTDTGGFTYNSTRPEIFHIVSLLLAKGVNKDKAYKRVYHSNSLNCIRMRAYVMFRKMQVVEELHAAYFSITKQEMKRFRYQKGDAEGLVNEPLKIKGMKLSISLREDTERENLVMVSLRSSCGFHCEKMAREYFNGGGHEDAAGGRLYCSIEEAEQVTLRAIMAYKDQL